MTLAEYMDSNDYETLQKTIFEITEILHDFVQGIINGKEPLRKKRGISNSNETRIWSGLADEIEKLMRFIFDGVNSNAHQTQL